MNKSVGVLIIDFGTDSNVDRCLDSISLQTKKAEEIKVVEKFENDSASFQTFVKMVSEFNTECIYICPASGVLAPDLLEKMSNTYESNGLAVGTEIYFYNGQQYISGGFCERTGLGKLFNAGVLKKIVQDAKRPLSFNEISSQYKKMHGEYLKLEDSYLYENSGTPYGFQIEPYKEPEIIGESAVTSAMSGYEISQFFVEQSGQGKIGLRTIKDSLFAWMKYKRGK